MFVGKTFHFLAGMHRSGNTVLSAILNQNPMIYVSPLSPMPEYIWRCHLEDFQDAVINPRKDSKKNMVSKMMENYYDDIDKPIVFDRSKVWANPGNLDMIKQYITDTPKIIFTVRPLRECLASMIQIDKDLLLKRMNHFNYNIDNNISLNDNIAKFALDDNIFAINAFTSLSINNPENANIIHLVKYNDLLQNPQTTLDNIYNFLGLNSYIHDFNNIIKIENELDEMYDLPSSVHEIRKKLSPSGLDVSKILSKDIIEMCNQRDLLYN